MTPRNRNLLALSLLGIVTAALVGTAYLRRDKTVLVAKPSMDQPGIPIMSTTMHLTAVLPARRARGTDSAFVAAEQAARIVEARMNRYNPDSELSGFNAAPADELVPLSEETMDVLRQSAALYQKTDQAFDITVLPLLRVWQSAAKADRLPSEEQVQAARAESRWAQIELTEQGARKSTATAGVDLGGIAKGFAMDLAVEAMRREGVDGGIVEIGGDLRCFGSKPDGRPWRVQLRDPFVPGAGSFVLAVRDAAVCTSGNYERGRMIAGQHFSHILDPRLGRPVDTYPSVTVVAGTAAAADAWATALSVLGPDGFALLDGTDLEAMIIVGTPEMYTIHCTPGFSALVAEPVGEWTLGE
jgi:thiamine biosynthesis lipoprotein